MDIYKLKDLPPDELETVLAEADSVVEEKYFQPLTQEEMEFFRHQHSDNAITLTMIEHEFKRIADEYKERMKPYRTKVMEALEALRTRQIEKTGKVYLLKDHDTQMVHKIDGRGNVIQSRTMLPEERQYFLRPTKNRIINE